MTAQTVQHAKKHQKRYQELFENETSFDTWFNAVGRAGRWADGKMIQAAAERIGQPIVIWEEKAENEATLWARFVVGGKFSQGIACGGRDLNPICLVLKNQHYQELVPGQWSGNSDYDHQFQKKQSIASQADASSNPLLFVGPQATSVKPTSLHSNVSGIFDSFTVLTPPSRPASSRASKRQVPCASSLRSLVSHTQVESVSSGSSMLKRPAARSGQSKVFSPAVQVCSYAQSQ